MPRPGTRPYECVRRAWHSERHQPIRGSLIQDIFRIAHDIHSPATKKKKEWQEKLPIVVLKAEEIMYSKANSEVEYMDPKTLWDRTNDAINTIIRRDESSEESGEFLQPCIEAALHLGCVPRRTSRSQRNNHPRGYLTGNPAFPVTPQENAKLNSCFTPPYSNILRKEPQKFPVQINSCLHNEMQFLSGQASYPVYPLYYGVYKNPQTTLPISNCVLNNNHQGITTTMPPTLYSCREEYKMPLKDNSLNNTECDLSLRLGFGSTNKDECSKNKPIEGFRKRKAVEEMNDQRCSWQPKIMPAYSNGWS